MKYYNARKHIGKQDIKHHPLSKKKCRRRDLARIVMLGITEFQNKFRRSSVLSTEYIY